MPPQYDPEYFKTLEPFLPMMAAVPQTPVHDIETRRAQGPAMIAGLLALAPLPAPDVDQTEHKITGPRGDQLTVYQWAKKTASAPSQPSGSGPALLHAHGGGMILYDALLGSALQKWIVQVTGIPVFSVDYRLAPESKDAELVEDVYAGLAWLSENAAKFNVDPARIAVFGESAGGGIAAGVALMARDKRFSPPLAKQILIYPMLDDSNLTTNEAVEPLATWKTADNITGWTALLGDKTGKPDADVSPYAAPARVKSVAGLPPTYIDVGTLDNFRDEDAKYASRIAAENVEVEFHLYPGLPHAFELAAPQIPLTKQAWENRLRAFRSL